MENELEEFSWFTEQYEMQIDRLEHKIDYLRYRDKNFLKDDPFLIDIFLESILVDIRAIMLESKKYKSNYTVQNSIKRGVVDKENILCKIAEKIDEFFQETKIDVNDMNLFEALKFYTDKFIAHRDSISKEDYIMKEALKKYFIDGEWSVVSIVEVIVCYTKEWMEKLMLSSISWLTSGHMELDDDSKDKDLKKRNYDLENVAYENLLKCPPIKIDQILHLKARGIVLDDDFKANRIIREIFNEKIEKLNNTGLLKLILAIKSNN